MHKMYKFPVTNWILDIYMGFPDGTDGKGSACNAGDLGSIPGSGKCCIEGNVNPLWYSCLENPHGQRNLTGYGPGVTKSQTQLRDWSTQHICISSVQFSRSVMSSSLRPHELQHARPPCPSPTPGVHSDSRPLSQWCHPTISSSVIPFSSCPQSLPAWVFSNESTLYMRWLKYWSFSFSIIPSKEFPGLISFRMDWLDLLAVQGTLKSLLQHHSSKAPILA